MRTRDEILEAIRMNDQETRDRFRGIEELKVLIEDYRDEIRGLIKSKEGLYREIIKINSK